MPWIREGHDPAPNDRLPAGGNGGAAQLHPGRPVFTFQVGRLGAPAGPRLSDREVGVRQFRAAYGHDPDLERPRLFDEKIQWYKLFYRRPLMTELADKVRVRAHVAERGLGHLLNDLYGVWERADQIPFEALPPAFVLKANHGCGWNILVRDKRQLDPAAARAKLSHWLGLNYFDRGREWAYKHIPPRILCERYLENAEYGELIDYKFYCYGGEPQVVFVCCGRFGPGGVRYDAYDMDWRRLPVAKGKPAAGLDLPRPANLEEMRAAARALSAGFPFLRVDLYSIEGRITFGELTFYPDNGKVPFRPEAYNRTFGDLMQLPAEPVLR